jgi:hypothetical protein
VGILGVKQARPLHLQVDQAELLLPVADFFAFDGLLRKCGIILADPERLEGELRMEYGTGLNRQAQLYFGSSLAVPFQPGERAAKMSGYWRLLR